MIEKNNWHGEFKIKAINTKTKKVIDEKNIKNTIMNQALDELFKSLFGQSPNIEVKYIALGTGTATVQTTQTQLINEQFRVGYASRTTTSDWKNITNYVILDNEANFVINEIGIFGGTTASATSNSGIMISRITYNYDKTATNIELQIQRTDQLARG